MVDKQCLNGYNGLASKELANKDKDKEDKMDAIRWATENGYYDIETATSDELIVWTDPDWDSPSSIGIKVWRQDGLSLGIRDMFVAERMHGNGEPYGPRGFGPTMVAALADLAPENTL